MKELLPKERREEHPHSITYAYKAVKHLLLSKDCRKFSNS